jgi:hypothetical protein
MPDVLKTSKDNGHWHLVYQTEQTGTGYTSIDKGHGHTLALPIVQEAVLDPGTGDVVQPPVFGEDWVMNPAEDGHTHLTEPVEIVKPKTEDEEKTRNAFFKNYTEIEENERVSYDRAIEAEEFVAGEQWKDTTKKRLEGQDRAALVLNEIQPKIDLLSGHQRKNRMDIRYLPVEGSDNMGADIMNLVVKNIASQNTLIAEESEIFNDQTIAGRGNINVDVSFDENIEGDIKVEWFPWQDVLYGPHYRKDLRDLEVLYKRQWWAYSKASEWWPDKADDIDQQFIADRGVPSDGVTVTPGKQYDTPQKNDGADLGIAIDKIMNATKKTVLVLERWLKTYKTLDILVHAEDGFFLSAEDWEKEAIAKARDLAGFKIVKKRVTRMRITTFAGKVKVGDDKPDLAVQDFYMIAVYCKLRRSKNGKGNWWGKVAPAMDPQRNMNKRESQMTDILNKVAAYGYYIDHETFPSKREERNFRANSSRPGFVQKVRSTDRLPKKEEGVNFPSEMANMIAIDRQALFEIMNVPPAMLGLDSGAESGVAIVEKRRQGLTGNEFLFDNMAIAKRKLGKLLAALVQQIYTAQRVFRIIQSVAMQASADPMSPTQPNIGGKPAADYTLEEIQEVLDNNDLTKYDIEVSASPWSSTMRRATLSEWSTLAQHGFPVPPQFLLDLTDLPQAQKEKVGQMIAEQKERQEKLENAKINSEVAKSQIAAQSKKEGGGGGG